MNQPSATQAPSKRSRGPSSDSAPPRSRRAPRRLDDLTGDLPRSYGQDILFLVAQEPHWLFTYWDIDISRHPGGPCFLRVEDENGSVEQTIEVGFETRNWYIPVKHSGAAYTLEIGFFRNGAWNRIARSAAARTPREGFSERDDFDFATIPVHLGFQKLVETVSRAGLPEDGMATALAKLQRLQKPSVPPAVAHGAVASAALGSSPVDWAAMDSERLHSEILARISGSLTSGEWPSLRERLRESVSGSAMASSFENFSAGLSSGEMAGTSAGVVEFARVLSSWIAAGLSSQAFAAPGMEVSSFAAARHAAGLETSAEWMFPETSATLPSGLSSSELAARAVLAEWLSSAPGQWSGELLSQHAQALLSGWSSSLLAGERSSWHGSPQ